MIDPDDLTIEPNDDATCDDYWACDDDAPTDDTDDEPQEADDHPESDNPYYDGT